MLRPVSSCSGVLPRGAVPAVEAVEAPLAPRLAATIAVAWPSSHCPRSIAHHHFHAPSILQNRCLLSRAHPASAGCRSSRSIAGSSSTYPAGASRPLPAPSRVGLSLVRIALASRTSRRRAVPRAFSQLLESPSPASSSRAPSALGRRPDFSVCRACPRSATAQFCQRTTDVAALCSLRCARALQEVLRRSQPRCAVFCDEGLPCKVLPTLSSPAHTAKARTATGRTGARPPSPDHQAVEASRLKREVRAGFLWCSPPRPAEPVFGKTFQLWSLCASCTLRHAADDKAPFSSEWACLTRSAGIQHTTSANYGTNMEIYCKSWK